MTFSFSLRTLLLAVALLAITPLVVSANADCSFNRTLSLGDEGEDVRCLQVFLNGAGYEVATVGVGSPGRETTTYGSLTEAAVLRWQQAVGVAGANGNFGPASQIAYASADTTVVASAGTDESLNLMIESLQQQLALGLAAESAGTPVPQVAGVSDSTVATIDDAIAALTELVTSVRDMDEDMGEVTDAALVSDALEVRLNLYNGLLKMFAGEYTDAIRLAEALLDDVDDIEDDLEEADEADEAEEALDDVWDEYKDADDEVDEAEDNDESGADDARDDLDEAKELLEEAEDELDDEDYDDVLDLVDEIEDLIDDALDEL